MVPAAFVPLAVIPLLPNGKIDRGSLPSPARASASAAFVAPATPVERALAGIWAEVLGVERVGARDDFFALGGHSLLASRLFDRIGKELGTTLPVVTLFQAPTIERLAEALQRAAGPSTANGARSPSVVALRREGSKRPLFLARPAVRSSGALVYAPLTRQLDPDRPVYAFVNRPLVDEAPRYASIEAMAAEYVTAMREVQPRGPYLVGGWSLGGKTAFEMARQLVAQGERVERLVLFDPAPPVPLRDQLRFFGKYAATRARLRLAGRLPAAERLLRWGHPILRWSAMRRFGGLAYYDPDNAEVATIQHVFPGLVDGASLRALPPAERWERVYGAARAADPASPDEGTDVARVRRGYACLARDHAMNVRYAPRSIHEGDVTMFVVRGDTSLADQWRPFLARPPRVIDLDIQPTRAAPTPHEALVSTENTAALAAALDGVLG